MSEYQTVPSGNEGPPALFAWLVHAFTATGVVFALLAFVAIEDGRWVLALTWLFIALAVDGIDGSFARWAHVKERAPRIDGDTLDLVIDYLTYVFIPTIFIWRAGLIPPETAFWLAAAVQYSSLYLFSRSDMKTEDGYFRGFPALWNLVAFYLFVTGASPGVGAIVVIVLVGLTFAPVHFVHPFRVRDYGRWLPALAMIWAASTIGLLLPNLPDGVRSAVLTISLASAAVLLAMGFLRSFRRSESLG